MSDERKFIHDLASPIGTAMFLVDSMIETLKERSPVESSDVQQLEQVYKTLERIRNILQDRREVLIQQGVK